MVLTQQIARQIREVHFGGNWTESNLKDAVNDVSWQQATTAVYSLNTIAALVYHINYYVTAILRLLQGGALESSDKFNFALPPVTSEQDWKLLLDKTFKDAEQFAALIEQLPESKLWEDFWQNKYGSFYRNILGNIEHIYYHLGQIVLLKKIITGHR